MTFNKPMLEEKPLLEAGTTMTNALFGDIDAVPFVNPNLKDEEQNITVEKPSIQVDAILNAINKPNDDNSIDTDDDSDKSNGSNDSDLEFKEDNESEEKETSTETNYEMLAEQLYAEGLVKGLPEDVENIPDLATYVKVLKYNQELYQQEVVENVYTELGEKLTPFARQIVNFDLDTKTAGGDIVQFVKSILYTIDIDNLDVEDPTSQEDIISQYLVSAKNMSKEEVEDFISVYRENPDKLKAKATELKPKLVELAKKDAEKQVKEQELIKQEEDEKKNFLAQKIATQLQTGKIGKIAEGYDDIPLDSADANWLYSAIMNEKIPVPVKGKKVDMEYFDALSHFHKYHKDGDINKYLMALMIMKEPNKILTHFKKIATKEVVKEVRKDNTFGSTGLVFSQKKQEPKVTNAPKKQLLDIGKLS